MSQISAMSSIATQMVSNISILSHISGYGLINDAVFSEFRQKLEDLAQTYLKLVPGMAAALGELDNPSLEQFTEWLMNLKIKIKFHDLLSSLYICRDKQATNTVTSSHVQ